VRYAPAVLLPDLAVQFITGVVTIAALIWALGFVSALGRRRHFVWLVPGFVVAVWNLIDLVSAGRILRMAYPVYVALELVLRVVAIAGTVGLLRILAAAPRPVLTHERATDAPGVWPPPPRDGT
jgi:hypothetical protein